MVGRGSRHGVDAHSDKAAGQNIARETRSTGGRDLGGELNRLGLISLLLEGDGDIGIALGNDGAGCDAGRRHLKPGDRGLGTRGCRCDADIFRGAARNRGAAAHDGAQRQNPQTTHTDIPPSPPGLKRNQKAIARPIVSIVKPVPCEAFARGEERSAFAQQFLDAALQLALFDLAAAQPLVEIA